MSIHSNSVNDSPGTSLPSELEDEILSINAIYGDGTLSRSISSTLDTSSPSNAISKSAILLLSPPPSHPLHPTTLLLSFPPSYPSAPCTVLGPGSIDPSAAKGAGRRVAEVAQQALDETAVEGEPCVFALLTELETRLAMEGEDFASADLHDASTRQGEDTRHEEEKEAAAASSKSNVAGAMASQPTDHFLLPELWTTASPIESHKSVFLARAVRVYSNLDVADATNALMQDKHVARATHNIRAWRIRGNASEPVVADGLQKLMGQIIEHQESDDDGEAKAGGRVLAVMAAMDVWNVLVVVSRWYGGIKLGPERFRIIGQAARDVLVKARFSMEVKSDGREEKGRKKKMMKS